MGNYWKVAGSELNDQLHLKDLKEQYSSGKLADASEVENELSKVKYPEYLNKIKLEGS